MENQLEKILKLNKVTQLELSKKLGLTAGQIGHYVRGEQEISIKYLVKICAIFNVTIEDIYPNMSDSKNTYINNTNINNNYYGILGTIGKLMQGLTSNLKSKTLFILSVAFVIFLVVSEIFISTSILANNNVLLLQISIIILIIGLILPLIYKFIIFYIPLLIGLTKLMCVINQIFINSIIETSIITKLIFVVIAIALSFLYYWLISVVKMKARGI